MLQQWASEGEFYIGGAGSICVLRIDVIVLNFIEPVTFVRSVLTSSRDPNAVHTAKYIYIIIYIMYYIYMYIIIYI